MNKKYLPFQHMTYSIYRCEDCKEMRSVTNIPAMIDGVIQDGPTVADVCSLCKSTNLTTLFETKSADEFSVYCQIIAMGDDNE